MNPVIQEIKANRHDGICRLAPSSLYCIDGKPGVYSTREEAVKARQEEEKEITRRFFACRYSK